MSCRRVRAFLPSSAGINLACSCIRRDLCRAKRLAQIGNTNIEELGIRVDRFPVPPAQSKY